MNWKRVNKIILSLGVVVCIVLVSFALIYYEQSLRPFMLVIIFSILGFIVGKTNIKQNEDYRSCLIESSIIIAVLMLASRIGVYVATQDFMLCFNPTSLLLSFLAYFGMSNIISLVLYYINDEQIKI